ncbi:MAG: cupin domain-containing protein [Luteolibacter sp.]
MIGELRQEQASLYVMGLLAEPEVSAFEAELLLDVELSADVASLNNATVALARSAPRLELPRGSRERLMASVDSHSPQQSGYRIVRHNEEGWQETDVPGFRIKPLSTSQDMGYQTLLIEFAPGTSYPGHAHESSEQVFVLSGSLQTEGRLLGPGDFIHADAGTQHQMLYSKDGCRALLICRAA